ncbi:MAG TPA: hypothetical protein VKP64_01830 [Mycobacteriales bacterium]|nr:hypothetical protein [Mycobacteriales bacterium]
MSTPEREEDFRLAGDDPLLETVERMTASRADEAAKAAGAAPEPIGGSAAPAAESGAGSSAGSTAADLAAETPDVVGSDGVIPADPFEPDASQ